MHQPGNTRDDALFCANSTKNGHKFCEVVWLTLNEFESILSSTNKEQQKAVRNPQKCEYPLNK